MKIDHVAIWAKDIEKLKGFYERYFNAKSNDKYINPKKNFESYFLSFESGARSQKFPNQQMMYIISSLVLYILLFL
jgi:lactoylglutathione lyase